MLFDRYEGADGFLYIGDPHLTSKKPNRRLESDFEIIDVTCDKFDQAIDKANELNAIAVVTGDLFSYARDSRALLMTRLFKSLRKAKHIVLCLPGNHDLLATEITDDTALAAVAASGLIVLFPDGVSQVGTFIFGDKLVGLGGVTHGADIPDDVSGWFDGKADEIVLITHHDIAFDGAYPGSLDPFPIQGCKLLVNGHMHGTKAPIRAGDTWWTNIGNIFRVTIADFEHVPSVWFWKPGMDTAIQHPLNYVKDVFDWTGKTKPVAGDIVPEYFLDDESEKEISHFVSGLTAAIGAEMPKSHDAGILLDDINAVKEDIKPKADVVKIIDALHTRVSKNSLESDQP